MKPRERILVTGGAGYLGSVLCHTLASYGHDVTIIDLGWNGENHIRYPYICDNLVNFPKSRLDSFGTVIHLACVSREEIEKEQEEANIDNHFSETEKLINNLDGQKLIYASSASVYGCRNYKLKKEYERDDAGEFERSMLEPVCRYGYQKAQCENLVSVYGGTSLRMGTLMGPSPLMRHNLVANKMVKDAIHEGEINVFGGDSFRPLLNVWDAANAYLWAMESYRSNRGIYNVAESNRHIITIANCIKSTVESFVGKKVKVHDHSINESKSMSRNYQVNCNKINSAGFTPDLDLNKTIEQLCVYYS